MTAALLAAPSVARAGGAYAWATERTVVGMERTHVIEERQTFHEITRQYNIGYNEVVDANPGLDPWISPTGTRVRIPSRWVLPGGPHEGIVINLAEMRLYYYAPEDRFGLTEGRSLVHPYPIGVGMEGFITPVGTHRVSLKIEAPTWFVPPGIRQERPNLPAYVPPGEDNPLGDFALKLAGLDYFIHGTNEPDGIGMRVSHGCVRLYPEDIRELFSIVEPGTPVRVVYEPVKAGLARGRVYLEVHRDYLGQVPDLAEEALRVIEKAGLAGRIDGAMVESAVREALGYPVDVTLTEASGHADAAALSSDRVN